MFFTMTTTYSLRAIVVGTLFALTPLLTHAAVPKTDGFVCPVISTDAVLNSPRGVAIAGGDYSVVGPTVSVPTHATNDDGAGSPGGDHAAPGDTSYTAIWASQ